MTYKRIPGTPPGINEIKNAILIQKELIPKNSDSPPHTPAIILLDVERRKGCLVVFFMISSIEKFTPYLFSQYIRYFVKKVS
jgi:hypothetical protein